MGPPKTWKTGAVVTSYPKPMLVLEGDEGGLDVIQSPILWIKPSDDSTNELENYCKIPTKDLTSICAVQFNYKEAQSLNDLFKPTGDVKTFNNFNKTFNNLFIKGCPWRTVVVDPVTVVQELVLASFASTNAKKMEDAQKWAGAVGEKVKRIMATIFTLPCHVVIIMHTAAREVMDPDTRQVKEVTQEPVLYGKVRNFIGSLPSQFFYQDRKVVGGKSTAFVQTTPDSRVKGIGVRWPQGLDSEVSPPTYDKIYASSIKSGEIAS